MKQTGIALASFIAVSQSYAYGVSAPTVNYAAPQNAYAAPQNAYAAPQNAYAAPQNAYVAQPVYVKPAPVAPTNPCAVTSDVQAGFKGIDSYGNAICVCPDWFEFVHTYDGNICRKVGPKGNAQYPCAVSTPVTAAYQGTDSYGNVKCICPLGFVFVSNTYDNQCVKQQTSNLSYAPKYY